MTRYPRKSQGNSSQLVSDSFLTDEADDETHELDEAQMFSETIRTLEEWKAHQESISI